MGAVIMTLILGLTACAIAFMVIFWLDGRMERHYHDTYDSKGEASK